MSYVNRHPVPLHVQRHENHHLGVPPEAVLHQHQPHAKAAPIYPHHPHTPPAETPHNEPGEHRGPCPALNALANGGDLPRDGRVTEAQLVKAMNERLGLARPLGALIAKVAMMRLGEPGPDGSKILDLSALVKHGFIEHDASLSRRDAWEGNAAKVVPSLVDQLLSLSANGRTLTLEDLAAAHQLRMAQSSAHGHKVPLKAGVLGTFEAALLYEVFHGEDGIALADAKELFEQERVPVSVPPHKVGVGSLLLATAKIALMGNLPFTSAARRARQAAAQGMSTTSATHATHGTHEANGSHATA